MSTSRNLAIEGETPELDLDPETAEDLGLDVNVPDADTSASSDEEDIEVPDDGLLDVQVHELGAKLLFDGHGRSPFYAIASQFDRALNNHATIEAGGHTWQFNHDEEKVFASDTGKIAAPGEDFDSFQWFNLGLVATDDPVGRRRVNFQFRVALPNATHVETGEPIQSLPDDLPNGVRVQIESANVEFDVALDLLRAVARELDVNPAYFDPAGLHEYSRVHNLAVYVRLRRSVSEATLVDQGGLLERLSRLASSQRGQGEYKWDNEEILGHYTHVALNPTALNELYGAHQFGKRLKVYHMATPRAEVQRATDHPKLEVQFAQDHSDEHGTVAVRADHAAPGAPILEDLRRELEALLYNTLYWCDLPLAPDPEVYVADEYFELTTVDDDRAAERLAAVTTDPTDALVEHYQALATDRLIAEPPTDAEDAVFRAYADGGAASIETIADRADVSESTVYRTARKHRQLLDITDRRLRAENEIVGERLREVFQRLERRLDEAISSVRHLDPDGLDDDSPLMRWAARYDVEVRGPLRELELHIGRSRDLDPIQLAQIIREGATAARQEGAAVFLRFAKASLSAHGYSRDRTLISFTPGKYVTAIGGWTVDVHHGVTPYFRDSSSASLFEVGDR